MGTVERKWEGGQKMEEWLEGRKTTGRPRKTYLDDRGGSKINGAEETELRKMVGDRGDWRRWIEAVPTL